MPTSYAVYLKKVKSDISFDLSLPLPPKFLYALLFQTFNLVEKDITRFNVWKLKLDQLKPEISMHFF